MLVLLDQLGQLGQLNQYAHLALLFFVCYLFPSFLQIMVNEAYILRFRNQQRNYIYNIYRSSPFGRVCPNTNIHRPLSPHPTIHKPQLTPPYVSNLPSVTIDSFFHPNKPGGYDEGIPDPYHQVGDPFLMGPSLPGRGSLFQQILVTQCLFRSISFVKDKRPQPDLNWLPDA